MVAGDSTYSRTVKTKDRMDSDNGIDSTSSSYKRVREQQKTTRVCIKNVPISFSEEKLKKHLTSQSQSKDKNFYYIITDCKILKTRDGKSRKLAFVGFKKAEMAEHCVSYFNKSYAGTSKLLVDFAFAKKQELDGMNSSHHRPWSKYSEGSSRFNENKKETEEEISNNLKKDEKEIESSKKKKHEEKKVLDQKKEEFLAAMGAGSKKGKFWANDDGLLMQSKEEYEDEDSSSVDSDSTNEESSSSNNNNNNKEVKDSTGESKPSEKKVREKNVNGEKKGTSNVIEDNDDIAFLKSKTTTKEAFDSDDEASTSSSSSSEDDEDDDDNDDDDSEKEEQNTKAMDQNDANTRDKTTDNDDDEEEEEEIMKDPDLDPMVSSTRLFVRNLPFQSTEEDLHDLFSSFGTVLESHIPIDDQKNRKGFAFVRFSVAKDAKRAKEELDQTDFQGRLMHILFARKSAQELELEQEEEKEKKLRDHENGDEGDGEGKRSLTYKEQQEKQRQRNAPSDTSGWNASILRTDAVVDNLASRLDLEKSDILNSSSGKDATSAAVRLALGETHILKENKEYFAKHGIDMEGLIGVQQSNDGNSKGRIHRKGRSSTQILLKNLPYNSNQEEELHKLFANHNAQTPERLLLPPSKTVALIEYDHPTEARTVFRKLAYKKFHHVPLYLEWAPLAAIQEETSSEKKDSTSTTTTMEQKGGNNNSTKQNNPMENNTMQEEESDNEDDSAEMTKSIYVKNLNFSTTEKDLEKHFKSNGIAVRAVKIPTKVTPSSKIHSMGYGFIECQSSQEAKKALRKLNKKQSTLDGHTLQLSLSSKKIISKDSSDNNTDNSRKRKKKKKLPTKIALKNIPFQATKSEISSLFGTFGKMKSFRLPKKFGSAQHRGFGFLEFVTGEEAQNAMENLSRTHLYGRKLVLEWAEEDLVVGQNAQQKEDSFAPKGKRIKF